MLRATLILAVLLICPVVARADALSAHVDFSIGRAVKYLYSLQRPDGSFRTRGQFNDEAGPTALALLALQSSGESISRPEMRRGYDWLMGRKIDDVYSLSLRAAALSFLREPRAVQMLRRDTQTLIAMQIDRGDHRGLYSYTAPKGDFTFGDLSNSQYGVLGVWYAAEAGIDVPRGYWQRVEDAWTAAQSEDGGFGYRPGAGGSSYGSMTSAGIATLAITHDYLHAASGLRPSVAVTRATTGPARAAGEPVRAADRARGNKSQESVARAVEWLDRYFLVDRNPGRDTSLKRVVSDVQLPRIAGPGELGRTAVGSYVHYMLFGYERAGEATGLTRFGPHKWFEQGARYLIATQNVNGEWDNGTFGPEIDTSYALLFLSRGRSPVVVQKLQWEGRWNNRPRDAAGLVRWLRRQTERHVNWQITRLDYPFEDVREAPILYLASDEPFDPPAADEAVLRRYIDEGGLLLAADESGDRRLAASVERLLTRMYPAYSFRTLPKEHPFISGNLSAGSLTVPVRALSNGVRELAVVLPEGDLPAKWQRSTILMSQMGGQSSGLADAGSAQATTNRRDVEFALLGNILIDVTGRASLRFRGDYHLPDRDAAAAAPEARWTVARIVYAGNWDPEPAAYPALATRLHNSGDATLTAVPIEPGGGGLTALAAKVPLAHLTASHTPALDAEQRADIAGYLRGGGVLLIDSAGGASELGLWAEPFLSELLPGLRWQALEAGHPIYAGVVNGSGLVPYRPSAVQRVGSRLAEPRLRAAYLDGRLVAVFASEDLVSGLPLLPHDGIVGYAPEAASRLVSNLIRWAHR